MTMAALAPISAIWAISSSVSTTSVGDVGVSPPGPLLRTWSARPARAAAGSHPSAAPTTGAWVTMMVVARAVTVAATAIALLSWRVSITDSSSLCHGHGLVAVWPCGPAASPPAVRPMRLGVSDAAVLPPSPPPLARPSLLPCRGRGPVSGCRKEGDQRGWGPGHDEGAAGGHLPRRGQLVGRRQHGAGAAHVRDDR